MEISRARFLILASALAASACATDDKKDDEGTGGRSSGGSGGATGGSSGSGGSDADASTGGTASDGGTPDGGNPDSSVSPEAGPEGGAGDGGDAATCDDSTDGGAPACDIISTSESCGFYEFQHGTCEGASVFMKPGIAAKVVSCIVAQSAEELCDSTNTYACKDNALKSACPDPTVEEWCTGIIANCPDAKITECRTYLSGLNDAGRDSIYGCMESDCFSLYSCVEGL